MMSPILPTAPVAPRDRAMPDELPSVSEAEAGSVLGGYRRPLCAYLRRKGFSAEEADDLTQETLIRAYLHLSTFRGVSLSAWLYRIAANVAVDHLRKQRITAVPLDRVLSVADETGEDPLEELDRDQQRVRMQSLIGELPECHQRILRLRYYEDRSMAEIAGEIDCSPMAAKLRVFRAVTALRKRCRSLGSEDEWTAG